MKNYLISLALTLLTVVTFGQTQIITHDWWAGSAAVESPPPEPVEWFDEFNIESGESVSATWNTDTNPPLINLGNGSNWTTTDIDKPVYNSTDNELEFIADSSHRVSSPSGYAVHPPVFEVWIKGTAISVASSGTLFSMGNSTIFGVGTDGGFYCMGMSSTIAGDTNEHVFRIVLNGANSLLQIDNGTPITFTEGISISTRFDIGIRRSGGNPISFHLKQLKRTADGGLLTTAQANAEWAAYGF